MRDLNNDRAVINALAEVDIAKVLPDIAGSCRVCGRGIGPDTLGGFVMVDSQPSFFCDRLECVEDQATAKPHG